MKKLLASLLPLLLLNLQALALSGGPVFGSTQVNTIGTYSGVLIPTDVEENDDNADDTEGRASAIGLFSFSQPDSGVGTGATIIFVDGTPYIGTMAGVIDPGDGSLRAVINATSTYNVVIFVPETTVTDGNVVTTFERQEFSLGANGSVEAFILPTALQQGLNTGALNSARIVGEAEVDTFFLINDDGSPNVSRTARFDVQGFKQTATADGGTSDFGSLFNFDDLADNSNSGNNNGNTTGN